MSRIRRSRTGTRGPKNNIWANALMNETAVGTAVVSVPLVDATDWVRATGLERATLLSVRGWLSVSATPTIVTLVTWFAVIYVADKDASAVSPIAVATYGEEDILWSGGLNWPLGGAGAVERGPAAMMPINIKAMRRITSGQEIRLDMDSTVASIVTVSGVIRSLLRLGGN